LFSQTVDQFFWACYRKENNGRADDRVIRHDINKYHAGVSKGEEIAPDYVIKHCVMMPPERSHKSQKDPFVRRHTHAHAHSGR
jgi:hypothetical protein